MVFLGENLEGSNCKKWQAISLKQGNQIIDFKGAEKCDLLHEYSGVESE
jgi:hypothetical protein